MSFLKRFLQKLESKNEKMNITRQLFFNANLAVCFFLICYCLDFIPSNDFVEMSAIHIYKTREFLLDVLLRVAPILVPIVLATSTVMLNKYTEAFFSIIFSDKNIRWLIRASAFFFVFHFLVVLFSSQNEKTLNVDSYILFFSDSVISGGLLVFTLVTCFRIFLYTQPTRLIAALRAKMDGTISHLHNFLNNQVPNKGTVDDLIKSLNQSIRSFTNLTIIAIKSKDYDTIEVSISTIGQVTWKSITELFKSTHSVSNPENDDSSSPFEESTKESQKQNNNSEAFKNNIIKVEEEIVQVHKDIFESAFSSKEFFACDQIIQNLEKLREELPLEKIFLIYIHMFETSLSYKYQKYTRDYCKNITGSIERIYLLWNNNKRPLKEYNVYFYLIKNCFDHKEPSILKMVLDSFKVVFVKEKDLKVKRLSYRQLRDAGLYSINKKSMNCFAELIRFLVTKGLNLAELNNSFSHTSNERNIISESVELVAEMNQLLNSQGINATEIFDVDKSNSYLKIKFLVVFYSYYNLQKRISTSRIGEEYRDLSLSDELCNTNDFEEIRTLLLDLETRLENWDKLFVSQAKYYFVDTVFQLLKINDRDKVEKELQKYGDVELLRLLERRIFENKLPIPE